MPHASVPRFASPHCVCAYLSLDWSPMRYPPPFCATLSLGIHTPGNDRGCGRPRCGRPSHAPQWGGPRSVSMERASASAPTECGKCHRCVPLLVQYSVCIAWPRTNTSHSRTWLCACPVDEDEASFSAGFLCVCHQSSLPLCCCCSVMSDSYYTWVCVSTSILSCDDVLSTFISLIDVV